MSRSEQPEASAPLTRREKLIGIWLLIFYLIMIAVTVATLPYFSDEQNQAAFDRAHDSF